MKIKIWTRTTDGGDGSSYVNLYTSKELARAGLDDENFVLPYTDEFGDWEGSDRPVEIGSVIFDITDCEVI